MTEGTPGGEEETKTIEWVQLPPATEEGLQFHIVVGDLAPRVMRFETWWGSFQEWFRGSPSVWPQANQRFRLPGPPYVRGASSPRRWRRDPRRGRVLTQGNGVLVSLDKVCLQACRSFIELSPSENSC